jgi:hypothetical protein
MCTAARDRTRSGLRLRGGDSFPGPRAPGPTRTAIPRHGAICSTTAARPGEPALGEVPPGPPAAARHGRRYSSLFGRAQMTAPGWLAPSNNLSNCRGPGAVADPLDRPAALPGIAVQRSFDRDLDPAAFVDVHIPPFLQPRCGPGSVRQAIPDAWSYAVPGAVMAVRAEAAARRTAQAFRRTRSLAGVWMAPAPAGCGHRPAPHRPSPCGAPFERRQPRPFRLPMGSRGSASVVVQVSRIHWCTGSSQKAMVRSAAGPPSTLRW